MTTELHDELVQALHAERAVLVEDDKGIRREIGGVPLAYMCQPIALAGTVAKVIAVLPEDFGSHRYGKAECRACSANLASVCLLCARVARGDCSHLSREAMYCEHCAYVYPEVASCVDEFEPEFMRHREEIGQPRGLDENDFFQVWAGDAAEGASAATLRLIAGYVHGWRTQGGKAWPLPEIEDN
ncbi:hypothetical protein [Curtobacterium sp. S6]|uniref:hypothetical protein n=1 Tax=Curtobacterium sp. S6 TaxID=1479623 RepID=UPI0004AB067D|nr:hypothetical protein [Curtobacterium sp. S6]